MTAAFAWSIPPPRLTQCVGPCAVSHATSHQMPIPSAVQNATEIPETDDKPDHAYGWCAIEASSGHAATDTIIDETPITIPATMARPNTAITSPTPFKG